MEDFGGNNEMERSLRALLETTEVHFDTSYNLIDVDKTLSDDQASKLGQFLLDLGRPVQSLTLYIGSLTATVNYHSLLQFIVNEELNDLSLLVYFPTNATSREQEVYGRFLISVARSTTIDDLTIVNASNVSLESFVGILCQNKSISSLQIFRSNDEWPHEAIEDALVHQSTVKKLSLSYEQDSAFVIGVIRAVKRSSTIEHLSIDAAFGDFIRNDTTPDLSELVEAIPNFPSLRSLHIEMSETYPETLHAAIMDGVRHNASLNAVSINNWVLDEFGIDRPTRNRRVARDVSPYMQRNRAIRNLNAANLLEAILRNMFAAAQQKLTLETTWYLTF